MTRDQAVRDRITLDFRTSFCVEAGAGTGKTTLMVDRILNQVLSGVPLSRIVAITFTEKAAGELKQRIREALEKKRSQAPDFFTRLTRALGDLDNAQISTIHGFAASILRERPVEARVDPNFRQLDELGARLLVDDVWEQWLDRLLVSDDETLKMALVSGLDLKQIRQLFYGLYQHRERADRLRRSSHSIAQVRSEIQRIIAEVELYLPFCKNPDGDKGFQQWSRALQAFHALDPLRLLPLVKFLREPRLNRNHGINSNWEADYNRRQKERASEISNLRKALFTRILDNLLQLLRQAVDAVEQEKNRRNVLDFEDLLLKARDLLLKDKPTRRYFQGQFQFVMVDEFQDTDPLQVEIAFLLCEEDARANRWQDVRLQPGKLCIVGDPKQSIYRFRRADIETYMEAQEKIATQGEILLIQENFRAAKPLIDWVNQTFASLICEEEKYQPRYQELLASDQPAGQAHPHITILYPPEEPENMDECREMEAAALVCVLRRIRQQQWQVRDREKKRLRDSKWRDIAILFYTLTQSYVYECALRAADIPYRLEGGKQFFSRQEIHALAACLKAIDDPSNQIALAAALRSMFFGFSDGQLFRLRETNGSLSYLRTSRSGKGEAAGPPKPGIGSELEAALALLRSLHWQRNQVSFAYTLERLYRETNALEKHLLAWSGRQSVANLEKAVARARAFEDVGPSTFRRFVKWFHQLEEDSRQEPESVVVESDEDAIQLISIHKSKGLEFPIVILANISSSVNEGDTAIWHNPSSSLAFHIKAGNEDFETVNFRVAAEAEQKRLDAEKKRLLYVGATRARDYLLISAFHSKNPQGLLKHLFEVIPRPRDILEGTDEIEREGIRLWKVATPDLPSDPELSSRVIITPEGEPTWEQQWEQWHTARAAAFQRAKISWSPHIASEVKTAWTTDTSFATPGIARKTEASTLGSAFHRVVYRMAKEDLAEFYAAAHGHDISARARSVPQYLKALVEQTAVEYGLDDPTELAKLVRQPAPAVLQGIFRGARQIHREVPFLLNLGEACNAADKKFSSLYEGIIDVVVEQPNGSWLVLDYKTDHIRVREVPERMARYRQQSRIYRAAVEQATGSPATDVYFYFVRAGVVFSERKGMLT